MSDALAAEVLAALRSRDLTLASAESLTGGGLGEAITSVPGASDVFLGGVIAYATGTKLALLGVPAAVVEREGAVSAGCARAMATGVRTVAGADVGVSTTGVAGPGAQEGKPAGLVFVAVADRAGERVEELRLTGDRATVRAATSRAALLLLLDRLQHGG